MIANPGETISQRERSQRFANTVPPRTVLQRQAALDKANEVRLKRAQLKRDLKAGREVIGRVLLEPPEWLETMHVFDLLLAVPKVGRVKVKRLFITCHMSPSKTVAGLSTRQRVDLIDVLNR